MKEINKRKKTINHSLELFGQKYFAKILGQFRTFLAI